MDIEFAQTIPMTTILEKLALEPVDLTGTSLLYPNPLRQNGEITLAIKPETNSWTDLVDNRSGSVIDFVCAYLKANQEGHTKADALRWLKNIMSRNSLSELVDVPSFNNANKNYTLKSITNLKHVGLKRYLVSRGINVELAKTAVRQIRIVNHTNGHHFIAIGVKNEDCGFAFRNPAGKGTVGLNSITFHRGTDQSPNALHIFKDFMDYLTVLTINNKPLRDDALVLNGYAQVAESAAYIHDYGYQAAYTWLDNSDLGKRVTKAYQRYFKLEHMLLHKPLNPIYAGFHDVNEWHIDCQLNIAATLKS